MDELAARTGRQYGLVDYHGAPDAERVIVADGLRRRRGRGDGRRARAPRASRSGCSRSGCSGRSRPRRSSPRCRRPTRAIAVLDRTKEPGAVGEPLYLDVVAALAEAMDGDAPPFATRPAGHRRALRAVVQGVHARRWSRPSSTSSPAARPKRHFTVGINDDVTHLSLPIDPAFRHRRPAGEVAGRVLRPRPDGTVGANKTSIKIIGEEHRPLRPGLLRLRLEEVGLDDRVAPALRARADPVDLPRSSDADFVACHQFGLLEQDRRARARRARRDLPAQRPVRPGRGLGPPAARGAGRRSSTRSIDFCVIDAYAVASEAGHGRPDQHGHADLLLRALRRAAARRGDRAASRRRSRRPTASAARRSSQRNFAPIDRSLGAPRTRSTCPARSTGAARRPPPVPDDAPDFVSRVTALLIAGEGDLLPVSALPVDGTFPTGTAQVREAGDRPGDPDLGPDHLHRVRQVRDGLPARRRSAMKVFPTAAARRRAGRLPAQGVPVAATCRTTGSRSRSRPTTAPAAASASTSARPRARPRSSHKAINMAPVAEHRDVERARLGLLPSHPRARSRACSRTTRSRAAQVLEPLFEFSGACAGCGETPYLKLRQPAVRRPDDRRQRHRLLVDLRRQPADDAVDRRTPTGAARPGATRCSRTTPSSASGMRLALDAQTDQARRLLERLAPALGDGARRASSSTPRRTPRPRSTPSASGSAGCATRSARVDGAGCIRRAAPAGAGRRPRPQGRLDRRRRRLGLRHRLRRRSTTSCRRGRNVNILVLDTEVYSNTGGQASKATPRGAVAKFAAAGKGDGQEGPRR